MRVLFGKRFFTAIVAVFLAVSPTSAIAGDSQVSQGAIVLNPGGGVLPDGSDGIKLVLNGAAGISPFTGADQVYFANTVQWCCTATNPMLNVGGTLFGEAGPAYNATNWTSISIVNITGANEVLTVGSNTVSSTDTGSANVTVRYIATKNSLEYQIDRNISYTYPNNFFTENYTFTIPAGNTEMVKFYQGGDAAPGSSDSGQGFSVSSPTVAAYEVNASSGIYISYQEVIGGTPFDGLWAASYYTPYPIIQSGGDIGFQADTALHDAGLSMQWTLGSAPGTILRTMITQAGFQSTQATASFSAGSITGGQPVSLNFQIVNTNFSAQNNLVFSATLPSGLTILGAPTSTCGGTLSAGTGSSIISLTGGSVNSGTNCSITIPVTGPTGSYTWNDQSLVVTSPLEKGFSTSALVIAASSTTAPELAATSGNRVSNTFAAIAGLLMLLCGVLAKIVTIRSKN